MLIRVLAPARRCPGLLGWVPVRASANLCPSNVPSLVRMFASWTHHDFVIAFPVKPSLDLHPRAQSELGEFFYQLYSRGVQSLIETHSEHLILRLQRYVGEGLIPPDHIAVNFVYASEGTKTAIRLPLSEDGIFTRPWPEGFFEERLDEALGLARAPLVRKGEIVVRQGVIVIPRICQPQNWR